MKRNGGVWIGTSGWSYKEWAGHFYPKGWPKKEEFLYYVGHFPTVEINATFYRLPTLKTTQGWREKSPAGFVFAVKGSRFLTHIKRLRDTGRGVRKYFSRLKPLAERTGPILWQLPPNFIKNAETMKRLDRFLAKLPTEYRHAVEFRHPSWRDEETFALLRRHKAANVWISSLRMPADHTVTGDFVFLRFHGLKGGAYHDYTDDELRPWARQLIPAARKGLPAFVYFNNDLNTRAPLNAYALMKLVGKHAVGPFQPHAGRPTAALQIAAPIKGSETWRPWKRSSTTPGRRPVRHRKSIPGGAARISPSLRGRVNSTERLQAAARLSVSARPPAR